MNRENQHIEARETKKLTPEEEKLLSEVEEITRLRMGESDRIHGIEHVEVVAWLAKYLAEKEGGKVLEAAVGGWLHDWGRKGETERREKGVKIPHAEVSRTKSQRLILQPLLTEGKITEEQYQRILAVIEAHSKLPEGKMLEKKILRDADRLSRFSAMGLQQVVKSATEVDGKPFYLEGQPITNPKEFFGRKNLKCAIDDINFVVHWREILETEAAKQLANKFKLFEIYESFLRTFEKYKDTVDQEIWLKWIASAAENSKKPIDKLKQENKAHHEETSLEDILALEAPDVFSEENFKRFFEDEGLVLDG